MLGVLEAMAIWHPVRKYFGACLVAGIVNNLPAMQGTWV